MIPFKEAFIVWLRVALYSFGGPAGQIAVMHKILVEEKRWINEKRFLHALNYCMLLPGPEAQQLATYMGWLLHKTKGGLVAGGLFVLPGFIAILVLSILYAVYRETAFVEALFYGIKPAVLAIVIGAVVKIGRRTLKNRTMMTIAVLAFVGIFFLQIPFPALIVGAGVIGFLGGLWRRHAFQVVGAEAPPAEVEAEEDPPHIQVAAPSAGRTVATASFWFSLWVIPTIALLLTLGRDHIFVQESVFFSKVAVVTFGGAYAVLAYIAQQAVEVYGWLQPGEMLDGLGMAETTPGPLIMVVQFVGFMGAFRFPGGMDPVTAGVLASCLVTWVTFVPCFFFIFVGAPYIEVVRGNRHLTAALSGITAAVVGVILNLGLWFGLNALFAEISEVTRVGFRLLVPVWSTLDPGALGLSVFAFVLYFGFKLNMLKTIGLCVAAGMAYSILVL